MFDFFAILSKGGIVLWYIQNTQNSFVTSINALIKSVILSEHGGANPYIYNELALKYHMDNEFKLIFVVGYQKVLQLSFVDKFISSLALQFRDRYRQELHELVEWKYNRLSYSDFSSQYEQMLKEAETKAHEEAKAARKMRSFNESSKSKKTMASMIVNGNNNDANKDSSSAAAVVAVKETKLPPVMQMKNDKVEKEMIKAGDFIDPDRLDAETILRNREKLRNRVTPGSKAKKPTNSKPLNLVTPDSPGGKLAGGIAPPRKGKPKTKGASTGITEEEMKAIDYSQSSNSGLNLKDSEALLLNNLRGKMQGFDQLGEINVSSDSENESDSENSFAESVNNKATVNNSATKKPDNSTNNGGRSMFGLFRSLVGSSSSGKLTREIMQPVLDQLRDRLIDKNVASEVSIKLCDGLATRLDGSQIGTFERVQSRVRAGLEETCTQLLQPKRRIDVLRDVLEAKRLGKPYVIVFCGVNGVGKSTNLAKIAFWLIEQNLRVLIVAGDTFRSGAVEQLRVHVQKLNYIHPPEQHGGQVMVELHERGYGKDAASIAMSGIYKAREAKFDVVLVDTAGRMQDNQPLMISLTKLININQPDLVLFVGEALVGNEAVDQLVKFNQALVDNAIGGEPRTIDGIVLTKFDTIDDKVGAAVSMTYISGQPILFVGTGQTYADLRQLSAPAVVKALMK